MTKILGLTGSIAMGKSTVAAQLAELGAVISDSDATVHKILRQDKELITQISVEFPQAVKQGIVDRQVLGKLVFADQVKLRKLEELLHPKVRAANLQAIKQAKENNIPLLILEIPLLYETGAEEICDAVIVVTTSPKIQHERVLSRKGMTENKLNNILEKQMPDAEKRQRADYIIDTSEGMESSKAQVEELISKL